MNARHLVVLHVLLLATASGSVRQQEQRYLADDYYSFDDTYGDDTVPSDDGSVPTKSPTLKPVVAARLAPTNKPVAAPNRPPVLPPAKAPTNAPRRISPPTMAPVRAVVSVPAPVMAPTSVDDYYYGGGNDPMPVVDDYVDDDYADDNGPVDAPTSPPVKTPTKPTQSTSRGAVPTPRPVASVPTPSPTTDDYVDDDYNYAGVAPTRFPTKKPSTARAKKPTEKPVASVGTGGTCRKRNWTCGKAYGSCCVGSGLTCTYEGKSKKGGSVRRCLPCKAAGSRCTKPADCCRGTKCAKVKHRPFKTCQRV